MKNKSVSCFLTLVCFFHFSAVHNGYSLITPLAAINPNESVSILKDVIPVTSFWQRSVLWQVSRIHRSLTLKTLRALSFLEREITKIRSDFSRIKGDAGARAAMTLGHGSSMERQEPTLKRENWLKLQKFATDNDLVNASRASCQRLLLEMEQIPVPKLIDKPLDKLREMDKAFRCALLNASDRETADGSVRA